MRTCDKCGKEFRTWLRIGLKLHNLNSRRYCLDCSPFGQHNTRPILDEVPDEVVPKSSKVCTMCGQVKPLDEYYKKGKYAHSECRSCFNKRSTKRGRITKQEAVGYKGGKCMRCGFVGHIAVYDFHHTDPKKKRFGISDFKNRSFDNLREELDKCVLLCANCHRELTALGREADWSFLR